MREESQKEDGRACCCGRGTSRQIGDCGPTECDEGGGVRHTRDDGIAGIAEEYEYKEDRYIIHQYNGIFRPLMHINL